MKPCLIIICAVLGLLFCYCCSDAHAILDEELTIEEIETERLKRKEQLETLEEVQRLRRQELEEIMEIIKEKDEEIKRIEEEKRRKEEEAQKKKEIKEEKRPEDIQKEKEAIEEKVEAEKISFFKNIIYKIDKYLKNLHPYVEHEQAYNDNIFLTNHDAKQDIITTVNTGGKYKIGDKPGSKTYLLFDSGVEFKYYAKSEESNRENPYVKLLFSHRFNKLSFSTIYTVRRGQRSRADLASGDTKGDFINYMNTYYAGNVKLDLNRLIVEPKYEHYEYRYRKDFHTSNSYKEDIATLTADVKILPKTYLFGSYNFGILKFYRNPVPPEDDDDYMYRTYWIGVRGNPTTKLKGLVNLGYQNRKYDNGKNRELDTLDAKLSYDISKYLRTSLRYTGKIEDSTFDRDASIRSNRFYFSCRYKPPFSRKLSFDGSTSCSFYDYKIGRDDIIYNAGVKATYNLKEWMKMVLSYGFKKRISDEDFDAEYKNHTAYLKITHEF